MSKSKTHRVMDTSRGRKRIAVVFFCTALCLSVLGEYAYRHGHLLVTAEAPSQDRTNFALSANGAVASVSSTYSAYNFSPAAAIDGEHKGLNWLSGGGWHGATNTFPQWLEIQFSGSKAIDEIDVFSVQDNYTNPSEPTEAMTFSLYGLTGYDVQYWDNSAWVTVSGGSVSGNNKVWRKITFASVTTTKVRVVTNASVDGWTRIPEVEAWGNSPPPKTNVALASNGAVASASSTYSAYSFSPAAAIDGEHKGLNWLSGGGWHASTNSFPQSLQIEFSGSKTIDEIDVFSVQDNYTNPSEPTEAMTFSLYGLTGYEVQYWDNSAWVTVSGGSVSGNNKVWRKITFASVTTTKIRVLSNASVDGWTRIPEIEAWGNAASPPPPRTNVALASNGALASASSTYPAGSGYDASPSVAINGNRSGSINNQKTYWNDNTQNVWTDWLQIDFGSSKTIDEIDVFTAQDNVNNPSEPTEAMTFSVYGLTGYDVQYWNDSAWVNVPGGSITSNNKIWRKITFASIATNKIRVLTNGSADGWSRITELEAWGMAAGSGSMSGDVNSARLDPSNRVGGGGEDPLSRNFNWSLPLVSLPGRSGLDLSLSLSYNSLVWTKAGNYISFNNDGGFPGAGFRLGFPVIQSPYYNSEVSKNAFLLITPDGGRTELRQVGASALYESADSTHILLDSSTMTLRTTDGTQLAYVWKGSDYECTQIKDSNGNFITINYTASGCIDTVIDTLARTIKFNYDGNGWLTSITQTWTGNQTHTWATFSYIDKSIQTSFSNLTVLGPSNGSTLKVISQITLDDGSRYNFDYTSWGQIWKVSNFAADNHLLNYRSYNLPGSDLLATSAQADCPRFTERHDWAENWNKNTSGAEQEAVTTYAVPVPVGPAEWVLPGGTSQWGMRAVVTLPDLTANWIYFIGTAGTASGWQRGSPALVNTVDSTGGLQRSVVTTWTQDNTSVSYPLNPRVTESNIYDPSGNHKRTSVEYTDFGLPSVVTEYGADASTIYRKTLTDYVVSSSYINKRIIGLPAKIEIRDGSNVLKSKTEFTYDSSGDQFSNVTGITHHDDTNYGAGFVTGRGNLTTATRYDMNSSATTPNKLGYNSLGQITFSRDASLHQSNISYGDSFSDLNNGRNTHAYPTVVQDPDANGYLTQYNFDFGGVTQTQNPKGAVVVTAYDSIGRLDSSTNLASSDSTTTQARTRHQYGSNHVNTFVRGFDGTNEAYSTTVFDGAGRVHGVASDFPGSTGLFKAAYTYYDIMGRVHEQTNPTEITVVADGSWAPAGDDSNFVSSSQTYDWKGRPLVSTDQGGKQKQVSYAGCGCAGGEVVTLTDEVGRKQKVYSDVFGRAVKTEVYSSPTTVNSTTVTTYDVLDRVTQVREYSGTESSSTYQDSTMEYDGYGRVFKTHKPEFDLNTYNTVTYNADDTVAAVTDPRGVVASYTYNTRHLVTEISYTVPPSLQSTVPATPTASFTYDSVGNRVTMASSVSNVTYTYDMGSRMTSETRTFNGVSSAFTISYGYNPAGALTSIQDAFDATVSYSYDKIGQLISVGASGSGFPSVTSFINSAQYRAWGAPKSIAYSNGVTESETFNSRLRPASYSLAWVNTPYSVQSTFDYHDDGRVNHAYYGGDTRFDRKFDYDFAGRVKEAYTGREARGLTPTSPSTDPYRQSMTYDAFGNQTSRIGMLWSRSMGDSGTFTNNRRTSFSYDAVGNVVTGGGSYKFDAAGSPGESITHGLSTGDNYYHEFTATITLDRDGAGMPVKRRQYTDRWDGVGDDPITESQETINTYSLHSSVLGVVIDEIDTSGAKTKGYVYAGGQKIADQDVTSSTNVITFKLTNPVTGSCAHTPSSGEYNWWMSEYDPVGAVLPLSDVYQEELGPPIYPDIVHQHEQLYVNGGDPFDYTGGCSVDGVPWSCADAGRLARNNVADVVFARGTSTSRSSPNSIPVWVPDDSRDTRTSDLFNVSVTITDGHGGHFDLLPGPAMQTTSVTGVPQKPPLPTGRLTLDRFLDLMNLMNANMEAEKRLQDPMCAALFNLTPLAMMDPIERAEMEIYGTTPNFGLETLQATQYRILSLGAPTLNANTRAVSVTGAATIAWNEVWINSQGPFFNFRPNVPGRGVVTMDMGTGLGQKAFAAVLRLHELGHQVGLFGPDANDGVRNRQYTQWVINACFPDARNHH